jgi:hypothetical protein
MFPKCNVCTGTFRLEIKLYTIWKAWSRQRLMLLRSYAQKSVGSAAGKGTNLKGKMLSSPRWIVLKSIVNIKGMNVILHRLHHVPINRWTVPPYCSRWLVFARTSRLDFYLLLSRRYKCNSILFLFTHDNKKKRYIICLFMLSLIFHMLLLSLTYTAVMKVCPSWPSSEDQYILREIMLRRTKGITL